MNKDGTLLFSEVHPGLFPLVIVLWSRRIRKPYISEDLISYIYIDSVSSELVDHVHSDTSNTLKLNSKFCYFLPNSLNMLNFDV